MDRAGRRQVVSQWTMLHRRISGHSFDTLYTKWSASVNLDWQRHSQDLEKRKQVLARDELCTTWNIFRILYGCQLLTTVWQAERNNNRELSKDTGETSDTEDTLRKIGLQSIMQEKRGLTRSNGRISNNTLTRTWNLAWNSKQWGQRFQGQCPPVNVANK